MPPLNTRTARLGRLLALLNMLNIEVTSILAASSSAPDENDPAFVARVTQACELLGLDIDEATTDVQRSQSPIGAPSPPTDLATALQDAAAAVTTMATVTSAHNALTAAGVLRRHDATPPRPTRSATATPSFDRTFSTSRASRRARAIPRVPSPPPLPEEEPDPETEPEEEQPPSEEEVEGPVEELDEADLWDGIESESSSSSDDSNSWSVKKQMNILNMTYEQYSEA